MNLPLTPLNATLPKNCASKSVKMLVSIILVLSCAILLQVEATHVEDITNPQALLKNNVHVKRFWGVPDTVATAGKLFNYSVPEDAFTGQVDRFEVVEASEYTLPKWLMFDQNSRTFLGVPTSNDQGQYYISVKAVGPPDLNGNPSIGKDVFTIEVVPELQHFSQAILLPHLGTEFFKCPQEESVTVASLFVDSTFNDLSPSERIDVISKLASFAGVSGDLIKTSLLMSEWKVHDNSAILAGPGTVKKRGKTGVVFQWQVGCSGQIKPSHTNKISELGWLAENGSLENLLGYAIIGWNVVNQQPLLLHREKREMNVRGTPVPEVPIPSKWPTFSEMDGPEEPSEETEIPESRVIPTMASPSFTVPSHRHRHHHGEEFMKVEDGHYSGSVEITPSPTYHYHHLPSSRFDSPMMTPVFQPERPSIYISSSVIEELQPSRSQLEEKTHLDIFSSSLVMSETEALPKPSRTFVVSSVVVTSAIQPTKSYAPEEPTKKPVVPVNYKPSLQNPMKNLKVYAGQVWSFKIPEDTFSDNEDGNTRNLKLIFMTRNRTVLSPSLWIQFDPEKQKLYALPLVGDIGKHYFTLEAMDSHEMSTFDHFQIEVLENPSQHGLNYEFTMTLKYKKWKYPTSIDWQIELVQKLAQFFGDDDTSYVSVQSVAQEPTSLTWTNFSLPNYPCPQEAIHELMRKLVANDRSHPTRPLKKAMKPEFNVQKVHVNFRGTCHVPPSLVPVNNSPELQNPLENIKIQVGEILQFKIPEDTFFDIEDGNTTYLKLMFLTSDNKEPPNSSWIQFNPETQNIFGLPFEEDLGSHIYQLVAVDREGKEVSDDFFITVNLPIPKDNSVKFSIHINMDYEQFNQDITQKILVAHKLARVFGDSDPRNLTVLSITNGSVVYSWTNNTLPSEPCPEDIILELTKHMIEENNTISKTFIEEMSPEFKIDQVNMHPQYACEGIFSPVSVSVGLKPPIEESAVPDDDDIYITTIIPAVVIVVMLIIAAMVACFLYRRRRKGKMKMQDSSSFMSKGIPIIFADELDEKPKPAKSPAIMKEEKPPLSSPENGKSAEEAAQHIPLLPKNSEASPDAGSSPPYHPPPPFTTNRDNKNTRPKTTPTYRQPPPYVPP
ncbi:dystroglycan-like [Limulus polyphemus]|uniref:Dystroglycan 1 n=1 Tax=Limulus polyphemus TaxID=6850 RepID=A0ABM1B5M3_LIMPO|nr:dystroglycan-like [Limulus polyphemus]